MKDGKKGRKGEKSKDPTKSPPTANTAAGLQLATPHTSTPFPFPSPSRSTSTPSPNLRSIPVATPRSLYPLRTTSCVTQHTLCPVGEIQQQVNRWPTGREAMCAVVYVHVEEGGGAWCGEGRGGRRIGLPGGGGFYTGEGGLKCSSGEGKGLELREEKGGALRGTSNRREARLEGVIIKSAGGTSRATCPRTRTPDAVVCGGEAGGFVEEGGGEGGGVVAWWWVVKVGDGAGVVIEICATLLCGFVEPLGVNELEWWKAARGREAKHSSFYKEAWHLAYQSIINKLLWKGRRWRVCCLVRDIYLLYWKIW